MIIGIDASRANRDHKSGTEWYAYYIIRWLAKLDDKNEYILYSDRPLRGGLLDLSTKVHLSYYQDRAIKYDSKGYQVLRSPHKNFKAKILKWPFANFWTLGRLSWEMIIDKPDLLFVPAHAMPLFMPKKSINTIHDVAFERDRKIYEKQDSFNKRSISGKMLNFLVKIFTWGKYEANSLDYLRWSTRFALRRTKKIITVSNFSKNEIIDIYKCDAKKIEVIHNGYSRAWFKKINEQKTIENILNKYGIKMPFILYIGRLEKKKNTLALIEAFHLAKEKKKNIKEKLLLIGDASYGYDEIKYAIDEFRLEEEVIMPGWVDEDDLPVIYSAATAFIFPSKHEGFGIPVLQAMACETATAVSDIPVLREIAGDAVIYFDPENISSITEAIIQIVDNKELRKELIKKGLKRSAQFSWEKTAGEILTLFNKI